MFSALFINESMEIISSRKNIANGFLLDQSMSSSSGEITVSCKTLREAGSLSMAKMILVLGESNNRFYVVNSSKIDNTGAFISVVFGLYGIERLLERRIMTTQKILKLSTDLMVCKSLIEEIQSDEDRAFPQIYPEVIVDDGYDIPAGYTHRGGWAWPTGGSGGWFELQTDQLPVTKIETKIWGTAGMRPGTINARRQIYGCVGTPYASGSNPNFNGFFLEMVRVDSTTSPFRTRGFWGTGVSTSGLYTDFLDTQVSLLPDEGPYLVTQEDGTTSIQDLSSGAVTTKSVPATTPPPNVPINIFIGKSNGEPIGTGGYFRSNIGYFKVWKNGILTNHLRPVTRDSDGAVLAYDLVTGEFLEPTMNTLPMGYTDIIDEGGAAQEFNYNDNVWETIESLAKKSKFQIDTIYKGFGLYQLYLRLGREYNSIILSDIDKKSKLNYVYNNTEKVATFVVIGGEGTGNTKKLVSYDNGETGFGRFERGEDEDSSSNGGSVSASDYNDILENKAKQLIKLDDSDIDFLIDKKYFQKLRVGDTIFVSSKAYKNGLLVPKRILERKVSIDDGVITRSLTLEEEE